MTHSWKSIQLIKKNLVWQFFLKSIIKIDGIKVEENIDTYRYIVVLCWNSQILIKLQHHS